MKRKKYITNEELIPELQDYKDTGKISNELAGMFYKIARGLSRKGKYAHLPFSWKDDMVQLAVITCVKYIHNF